MPALTGLRPLEIRLAPEYARCALYAAFGYLLIGGLVIWLKLEENDPSWTGPIVFFSIVGTGVAGLLALVTRYRIRIDEKGVWRRRFVHWDLWPWEAFEHGRVRHGKFGDQLTLYEKGRYWRTISASFLAKADRAAFEAVVARYRVPPPPPELPEKLVIKHGIGRRLELSADGVRLDKYGDDSPESFAWGDVSRVEILRNNHDRPDFFTLKLHLPDKDKPLTLTKQDGASRWTGASAEEIALFLRSHVDESRFEVTAFRGPPRDIAEADRRLALFDQADKQLNMMRTFGWYIFVIGVTVMTVFVLEPWNRPNPVNWNQDDWIHAAAVFGSFVVLFGMLSTMALGVAYFKRRDVREFRAELIKWRAQLETTGSA